MNRDPEGVPPLGLPLGFGLGAALPRETEELAKEESRGSLKTGLRLSLKKILIEAAAIRLAGSWAARAASKST